MTRTTIILCLLILTTINTVDAQHCGWDYAAILVLEVKPDSTEKTPKNLSITISDQSGKCLTAYNSDSCRTFLQNNPMADKNKVSSHSKLQYGQAEFWFAEDNYVFVCHYQIKNKYKDLQIKIEDIDGNDNGGHYETKYASVKKENFISLCNEIGGCPWYDNACVDKQAIKVRLTKKKK